MTEIKLIRFFIVFSVSFDQLFNLAVPLYKLCHLCEYFLHSWILIGYGIRIGSSTDKKDTGHLHVDYAQARDDLYEWECKQRMMARNERHRRRVEEERFRLPSPPPIVHYSEHESITLSEKLRGNVCLHLWSKLLQIKLPMHPIRMLSTLHL